MDERLRQGLLDIGRCQGVQVQLVGEPGRQPPGDLRPVAADEDRQPRLLDPLRLVDRVVHVGVPAIVGGTTSGEQRRE